MDGLHLKLEKLKEILRGCGRTAVAFSGGVDSAFLLRAARDALGSRCAAFTASSCIFPARELGEAKDFCARSGIRQEIIPFDALSVEGFRQNPPDRCYLCKKAIFGKMMKFAQANGLKAVLEGSNKDDDGDYRPGRRAIREFGRDGACPSQVYVASPLHDAGFTKAEIRALSRRMGLPTAKKPSFACLASRFPYGERITAEGLARVERAEEWLRDAEPGLSQLRVRSHGDMARIEVPPGDIPCVAARAGEIAAAFKGMGFAYAALDLQGYRTGSMNETLDFDSSQLPDVGRHPVVGRRMSNGAGQ